MMLSKMKSWYYKADEHRILLETRFILYLIMCLCICVCVCLYLGMQVTSEAERGYQNPLEQGLQVAMSHPRWVLGTEPRAYARAVLALKAGLPVSPNHSLMMSHFAP